jgi:hypothetical protein
MKKIKIDFDLKNVIININMTSVSVPKNSYMLWLKENRDNIKQMYFANYTPTIDLNGKKINLQTVLLKKAGEIWRTIDTDIKETYNTRLNELKALKELVEEVAVVEVPKIYCPNKCGEFRKTLDGMYSHLGLNENTTDNCSKKQTISKKQAYKKALEKLYDGTNESNEVIDFSQYLKKTTELPPPYEVKPNVQPKRKSIPKAVKTSVWNKYIETDDPNKLIGKCFVGCGSEITIANFEAGHVTAYSKGGSNKVDNLRPICGNCNKSMGTMNLLEFKETYGLGLDNEHDHEQDSKPDEVMTEEQLEDKIDKLKSKIVNITNENDALNIKQSNETIELDKCESYKKCINEIISDEHSKIQTKKCDINEQIDKLKLQIDLLQKSLKEDISIINKSISEHTIKLTENNTKFMEYQTNIESIKNKLGFNKIYLKDINIEKQKYDSQLDEINKQKEAEHNIMIEKLEQEVREELKQEQLRKQIKERLLQEQLTKQGDLINMC